MVISIEPYSCTKAFFEDSFDFVGIDTALVLLFVCDVKRGNVIVIVGIF